MGGDLSVCRDFFCRGSFVVKCVVVKKVESCCGIQRRRNRRSVWNCGGEWV